MNGGDSLRTTARQLVDASDDGVLSTISASHPGVPFGSWTPFALDDQRRPLMLLSGLAEHTRNLRNHPEASLCLVQKDAGAAPARITLVGDVAPVPEAERAETVAMYTARHPASAAWAGFGDFTLFRLDVKAAYIVAGFGRMGWIEWP